MNLALQKETSPHNEHEYTVFPAIGQLTQAEADDWLQTFGQTSN